MTKRIRTAMIGLLGGCLMAFAGGGAYAAPTATEEAGRCAALAEMQLPDTTVVSTTLVAASGSTPAFCRVVGVSRPAITFDVRLPVRNWNGKFYMGGCGVFCGKLLTENPNYAAIFNNALRRGYAVATTDTGHWGETSTDGRWAYHNPVAIADWSYRGVRQTVLASKATIRSFYGHDIAYSYFDGCSNGGRQGLIEAQRFPDDFDGIISGAPGIDTKAQIAFWLSLLHADSAADGQAIFPRGKIDLVRMAVTRECGDAEGLISDPRTCRFDPAVLQCKEADGAHCLTRQEVAVVRRWWAPPGPEFGTEPRYGGLPRGAEGSWGSSLVGSSSLVKLIINDLLRYVAMTPAPGPTYDPRSFRFDRDGASLDQVSALSSPMDPDLSKFKARGGKLLMYHGWADVPILPERSIAYHGAVRAKLGPATDDFFRLFMVPGMNHCGVPGDASPGVDIRGFDPLTVLEAWVEKGAAPTEIATTKLDAKGEVLWTRPVCAYPLVATYSGSGDRRMAVSWQCRPAQAGPGFSEAH